MEITCSYTRIPLQLMWSGATGWIKQPSHRMVSLTMPWRKAIKTERVRYNITCIGPYAQMNGGYAQQKSNQWTYRRLLRCIHIGLTLTNYH